MKQENVRYVIGTQIIEDDLKCTCGEEAIIQHTSNWHDGTGLFYMKCPCGREFNVRWMSKKESPAQRNLKKLPAQCYSVLLTHPELIIIKAGEKGYYRVGQKWPQNECQRRGITMDKFADILNEEDGITKAQREAMDTGSMFGWEVPGADADLYDSEGIVIKSKLDNYERL